MSAIETGEEMSIFIFIKKKKDDGDGDMGAQSDCEDGTRTRADRTHPSQSSACQDV